MVDNMQKPVKMLAFDFGASSGRALLGVFDGEKLKIEEIHRFSNDPVEVNGSLYWDTLRLFHEIKQGIQKCVLNGHKDISSIAIDTWGVDFGLLDEKGDLLGNPYHYRDKRTNGMMEKIFQIIPKEELYNKTGIEFMWFNTILQIYSMKVNNSPLLREAKTLLLTPDLFNYFLTGVKATEYSIASTTQLLDPEKGTWSEDIISQLGLPKDIFVDIVQPGTVIGTLRDEIAKELGVPKVKVVTAASHDTQSAIASVPAEEDNFAYISCGTWSLMGIEEDKPIINEKSSRLLVTNEGGVEGKATVLKNIMGLWLVQECKRQWDREGKNLSFADLENLCQASKPFESFIDPGHESFISPGDMPSRIKEFCRTTGQPMPETEGEIVRCIMQSLALKYRVTVEALEDLAAKELSVIHMVGGGIKDKVLCQFTANATGRRVVAGPTEATAIGNLMVQAMALGLVRDLKEIRQVVRNSFEPVVYEPADVNDWNLAFEKYKGIVEK
jgi:rhamnulokinase